MGSPTGDVIRSDYCGALVLSGETVTAVERNRIAFVRTHYRRGLPNTPEGIPIWAFKGK